MKKIVLLFILLFPFYAKCDVVTSEGLLLTDREIQHFKQLGFIDEQLLSFNQDIYDENINIDGILVDQDVKYFKTIKHLNKKGEYEINNNYTQNYDIGYEISKEEYDNSEENVCLTNASSEPVITEKKKMVTSLSYIKSLRQYRVTNYLHWKSLPVTRSKDIIGITNNNAVSEPVNNSYNLYLTISRYDECSMAGYSEMKDVTKKSNWTKGPSGAAASFDFPKNITESHQYSELLNIPYDCRNLKYKKGAEGNFVTSKLVDGLDITLYFNLSKVKRATLSAYGSFKHAKYVVNIEPTVQLSQHGFSISGSLSKKYDSMNNTQVSISKPEW